MTRTLSRRNLAAAAAAVIGVSVAAYGSPANALVSPSRPIPLDAAFTTRPADQGALDQIAALKASGNPRDANLVRAMVQSPQAFWFTGGTPAQVRMGIAAVTRRAAASTSIPTIVLYNVPGRDCSQYSAGGAVDEQAYAAWIRAAAMGIGASKVIVILEPDGLALTPELCGQPQERRDERFREIRGAVHALGKTGAVTYLDAGHSSWHAVPDMAQRLVEADVAHTRGFFINASNYRTNDELTWFGTLVSACVFHIQRGDTDGNDCAQHWGGPNPDSLAWLAANRPNHMSAQPHFVLDTSRNGQGPWTPPADHPDGDPQDWCNPPDRGLGVRPTARTGNPLVDAYLWIKTPGESDGSCTRWADAAAGIDPVRGYHDPGAGVWFPQQALELVHLASPPTTH